MIYRVAPRDFVTDNAKIPMTTGTTGEQCHSRSPTDQAVLRLHSMSSRQVGTNDSTSMRTSSFNRNAGCGVCYGNASASSLLPFHIYELRDNYSAR